MKRLSEHSVLDVKNKSHAVSAQIVIPEAGGSGVLIAQGGQYAGWSLYLHEGRPAYCYNTFGLELFKVYGDAPVPAGEHQVRMEFTYDGGGLGNGGDVVLTVDGERVGAGRVERTVPMIFSLDETTDLGEDTGSAVSDDYSPKVNSFNGRVRWVQIDLETAAGSDDHLISADERLRIAMARQ
jgi:arylsulfatase